MNFPPKNDSKFASPYQVEDLEAAEAAEGGVAEGDDAAVVEEQLADVVAAEEALRVDGGPAEVVAVEPVKVIRLLINNLTN